MSQEHTTTEEHLKSKWIDSQGQVTNWVEYAKEKGWVSETILFDKEEALKAKKYLPEALLFDGLGAHPPAGEIYTDDRPLQEDGSFFTAILTDRGSGRCWARTVRIEAGRIFVTVPSWPHGEVPFPLDHFKSIERVIRIDY
jgi:hypothetical protein